MNDNLQKLLILEQEYNKKNVFENQILLSEDELPKWKKEKIMKEKIDQLKKELTEFKATHTGYDPESPLEDFNFEVFEKVEDLEKQIIDLELKNYQPSEFNKFYQYLINVGIRSAEYGYSDDVLYSNIEYFKECYKRNLSAYKALLFLSYHLEEKKSE